MCAVRYHEGAVSVLQHLQHQPRKTFNILNLKKIARRAGSLSRIRKGRGGPHAMNWRAS